jgi:hypothetical protein
MNKKKKQLFYAGDFFSLGNKKIILVTSHDYYTYRERFRK